MFTKLAKILSPSLRKKEGFTLIELLIVVAIIAILAAIAIPQFSAYRRRGYNASANSDMRNLRTSEEAMMADFQDYGISRLLATDIAQAGVGQQANPAGSTMYLVGAMTTSQPNLAVTLSPGVYAKVSTNGVAATTKSSLYTLCTGHSAGDQYYGAESDLTAISRKGYAAAGIWVAISTGAAQCDAITAGTDITGNNWVSIQ